MKPPTRFEIMRTKRGLHPTRVDREWVLHQIDRAEMDTLRAIQAAEEANPQVIWPQSVPQLQEPQPAPKQPWWCLWRRHGQG